MATNGHTTQLDYLDLAEWRRVVDAARLHYEAETKRLTELLTAANEEQKRLESEVQLIEQVSRTYPARIRTPPKRPVLAGNNLRETLVIHFADSQGVIVGRRAIAGLLALNYFADRDGADGAVYTILSKPPFIRISRGTYRIPLDHAEWLALRGAGAINGQARLESLPPAHAKGKRSGQPWLMRKVTEIRQAHPTWTRGQVRDYLIQEGWDFGEKNPTYAVSMAFAGIASQAKALLRRTSPVASPITL